MKRILLTGMSGTGKSTVTRELVSQGHRAIDTDDGWCRALPDGRQLWQEDAITELLDDECAPVLFLAGCEENMSGFLPRFDSVVLLSAPVEVLTHRLRTRTGNSFGRSPEELARVLDDLREVEPLLRKVADVEIDTDAPLATVLATVLRVAGI